MMPDMDLVEAAVNAGVAVVLAVVVIYWNRQDAQQRIKTAGEQAEQARTQAAQEREDKIMMMKVVSEHSKVQQELILTLQELRNDLKERGIVNGHK